MVFKHSSMMGVSLGLLPSCSRMVAKRSFVLSDKDRFFFPIFATI
jgi:hypothetical protein